MKYIVTTATKKVFALTKRIREVQGGTSSSKTISILLYLISLAQSDKEPTITSIVGESIPFLKRGPLRDFRFVLEGHGYWKDSCWNATDSIYTFENGSQIEFFSSDNGDKLRGARRDRLFINEANNVTLDAFDQLEVRTKEFVILDWNPSVEFWIYTDVNTARTDWEKIILTYLDNSALSPEIVKSIEQRKNNKSWWRVYGLGELGEVEGKIYKDWQIVEDVPHEARLVRRGLDFGYSNDPSVLYDIYEYNGGFIFDEIFYQKGMSNRQIADAILQENGNVLVKADSAEPKSIDELKSYGCNVVGVSKGKGSVTQGIQFVQDQKCSITRRSVNGIKEYRNYLWRTDKNGKVLNEPEHQFSHCFAPETLVMTPEGLQAISRLPKKGTLLTRGGIFVPYENPHVTRTNANVVFLTFPDGKTLGVTPDHLLLRPDGLWIEAGLLQVGDLIQSATYEDWKNPSDKGKHRGGRDAGVHGNPVLSLSREEILQRLCERQEILDAQIRLGNDLWSDSEGSSYPSQGQESEEQRSGKSGVHHGSRSSVERILSDGRAEEGDTEESSGKSRTSRKEMAFVRRGEKVALVEWEEKLEEKENENNDMRPLSSDFLDEVPDPDGEVLQSELQDEGASKKVEGITRGFRSVTWNIEVPSMHCLWADGVIAHNSMDSIRYGLSDWNSGHGSPFSQTRPNFKAYGRKRNSL